MPFGLVAAYGAIRFLNVIIGEGRDTLFGRVTERAIRRLGLAVFEHLRLAQILIFILTWAEPVVYREILSAWYQWCELFNAFYGV
ncbi:hypothetical protein PEC18_36055 [Paucibacter sp. O1-1]|nr:hypothetical protein [Paucibacter sp. O1-1]MDA3831070.1 hypothetical protein [Paucibacter sp. O1-1]